MRTAPQSVRPAGFCLFRLRGLRFGRLEWLVAALAASSCTSRRRSSFTTSSCTPQSCTYTIDRMLCRHALPPALSRLARIVPARTLASDDVRPWSQRLARVRCHGIPSFAQIRAGCYAGPTARAGPLRRHVLRQNPPALPQLCPNGCPYALTPGCLPPLSGRCLARASTASAAARCMRRRPPYARRRR